MNLAKFVEVKQLLECRLDHLELVSERHLDLCSERSAKKDVELDLRQHIQDQLRAS